MAQNQTSPSRFTATILTLVLALVSPSIAPELAVRSAFALQVVIPTGLPWPAGLPVYDHVVIVVEENKDYEQIIGNKNASYINDVLRKEGASLTNFYAEEHHSEGNYFWLFSGSNQHVGFTDKIPGRDLTTGNLGEELIRAGHSFKGYSEGLPEIGSLATEQGLYARKHVPWVSFSNVPHGKTAADSSNLRYPEDFPSDYNSPKQHNSLLILTFDENSQYTLTGGLTDPADKDPRKSNRIVTILAGAHIKQGEYSEGKGVTHVNVLRTLEAMYRLNRSGGQPWRALKAGIADDFLIKDVFEVTP